MMEHYRVVNRQVVDAVQAVKTVSDRGDVRYPIKVSTLIFIEVQFVTVIYVFCPLEESCLLFLCA